jgi:hypothetical protein
MDASMKKRKSWDARTGIEDARDKRVSCAIRLLARYAVK